MSKERLHCSFFTARKRSLGQGNIFTPVCHSVHRGGCLPQCMLGYHPPGSTTPGKHTPLGSTPHGKHTPWEAHTPAPSPQEAHTPPRRRAYWEIWSTRGRYTSYRNAILFLHVFKNIRDYSSKDLNLPPLV